MKVWNSAANEIFLKAVSIDDSTQRLQYLDSTCADDPSLKNQVENLLQAHDRSGRFLAAATNQKRDSSSETRNGSDSFSVAYELAMQPVNVDLNYGLPDYFRPESEFAENFVIQKILGKGGMGVVALAEQVSPICRKVAIKIVRPESASPAIIARFERERKALALMTHPGIARILEAGYVDSQTGCQIDHVESAFSSAPYRNPSSLFQPYIVMEYVPGEPISQFCDRNRLGIEQRLNLVVSCCRAVQHAHEQGIIHRDLKPSNILVDQVDGLPTAKIIDFGIAKPVNRPLAGESEGTADGSLIGTLEYMAPEQAVPTGKIDARADVYSIGAILYVLLTGDVPHTQVRLRSSGLLEALQIISDEQPPPPSARVVESQRDQRELIENLATLRSTTPTKLTGKLSGDLDCIVMKALSKDVAIRYQSMNQLASDLERFLAHRPILARPPSTFYRLGKAARRHRTALITTTLLLTTIFLGVVGTTSGYFQAVRANHNEQLAHQNAKRANSNNLQATARQIETEKQLAKTSSRLSKAVRSWDKKDDALEIAQSALRRHLQSPQPNPDKTCQLKLELARCYYAIEDFESGVELLKEHFDYSSVESNEALKRCATIGRALARGYAEMNQNSQAVETIHVTIEKLTQQYSSVHPRTIRHRFLLGKHLRDAKRAAESVPVFESLLDDLTSLHGTDHPRTHSLMVSLGEAYLENGQIENAIQLLSIANSETGRSRKLQLEILPPLVDALIADHQVDRAESVARETAESFQKRQDVNRLDKLKPLFILGSILLAQEKFDQAEIIFKELLDASENLQRISLNLPTVQIMLAKVLIGQGRHAEATVLLKAGVEGLKNPIDKLSLSQKRLLLQAEQLLAEKK